MAVFNEPTKWASTLGASADRVTIPNTAGDTDPDISKIFPSVFSLPLQKGGKAIPRTVLNGLLKLVGDWSYYQQNGGIASYNADFDYAVGRLVSYNGGLFKCIQDNAHTDPHNPTDKDFWAELADSSTSSGLLPNQIIISPVPQTEANLHLLDGALLSGSGTYAEYVSMMIELYNSDPTATCWTDEASWQANVTTYGECGKFVIDTVNNTVRLPKITSFIQATSTASELGQQMEAGLPNITGKINLHNGGTYGGISSATGACTPTSQMPNYGVYDTGSPSSNAYAGALIDASQSNPIYGNSPTVQTQSTKYYFYIIIGTVSKTPIQVEIDNIATDLNGKADTDFSNITDTAKIAMAHNAMPSGSYVDLTLGASGTQYTMPADGYLNLVISSSVNNVLYEASITYSGKQVSDSATGTAIRLLTSVRKNDVVRVNYNTTLSYQLLRFFYAQGAISEA